MVRQRHGAKWCSMGMLQQHLVSATLLDKCRLFCSNCVLRVSATAGVSYRWCQAVSHCWCQAVRHFSLNTSKNPHLHSILA
jgi:hypothetical protein